MRKLILLNILLWIGFGINADPGNLYKKKLAFKSGEEATFNLYFNWGFIWIHAGDVNFEVQAKEIDGKKVYNLKVTGSTTKSFDRMYKIRDTFESVIGREDLYPLYYREIKHEDSYYANKRYEYVQDRDGDSTTVYLNMIRKAKSWKDTVRIDNKTFDLITTCYRVRNLDTDKLKLNQTVPFPMLFDDEIYDLGLTYKGKEEIKLKNGKKYNALKFVPKLITGDLFKKDEDMTIYVSDDENHVPLLIEAKIKVGYIKAMLDDVKNTKTPMSSLIQIQK
jgi:hypothetical protein